MRLVVFDLDGTLIDSVRHFVETVTISFEAVGQPVPDETTIRSISASASSDSLKPSGPKNFMPLSAAGLWLAEIITPTSALKEWVR